MLSNNEFIIASMWAPHKQTSIPSYVCSTDNISVWLYLSIMYDSFAYFQVEECVASSTFSYSFMVLRLYSITCNKVQENVIIRRVNVAKIYSCGSAVEEKET
jgi:hypothetical protein